MVVPVLMTNCHVSLNPKKGPDTAQTKSVQAATAKAAGRPDTREVVLAKRVKSELGSGCGVEVDMTGLMLIAHGCSPEYRFRNVPWWHTRSYGVACEQGRLPMKTHKHPPDPDHEETTRHLSGDSTKALELSAKAEHETGTQRERLIREAARRAK